jgi:Flp pilus assembly protein TadG
MTLGRILLVVKRLGAACKGLALVEFALIAPVLVLLYLGTIEGTSAVRAYMKVNAATQAYADLIANQPSVTKSSLAHYCSSVKLVITPLDATTLSIASASVTNTNGVIAQDWHDIGQCGSGVGSIAGLTQATGLTPYNGDSAIVVKASYAYSSVIRLVLPGTQTLTETAAARPRQNSTVDCADCTQN